MLYFLNFHRIFRNKLMNVRTENYVLLILVERRNVTLLQSDIRDKC